MRWSELPPAAKAFRAAHATWDLVGIGSLGYTWLIALQRRRDRLLGASIAFLSVEGVALIVGRGNCPSGPFQRRLGDAVAALTTLMPGGSPQTSVVWCDFDGRFVRVNRLCYPESQASRETRVTVRIQARRISLDAIHHDSP
jgi:hypothetical protein